MKQIPWAPDYYVSELGLVYLQDKYHLVSQLRTTAGYYSVDINKRVNLSLNRLAGLLMVNCVIYLTL